MLACVLADHSNSVGGGLSEGGTLAVGIRANSLADLHKVGSTEVAWTQVLHKVVKNEESEFFALLFLACEGFRENLVPENLDQVADEGLVGLEQNANKLGGGQLQVVLVLVVLFDELGNIVLVEFFVVIISFFLRHLIVLFNADKGVLDHLDGLL